MACICLAALQLTCLAALAHAAAIIPPEGAWLSISKEWYTAERAPERSLSGLQPACWGFWISNFPVTQKDEVGLASLAVMAAPQRGCIFLTVMPNQVCVCWVCVHWGCIGGVCIGGVCISVCAGWVLGGWGWVCECILCVCVYMCDCVLSWWWVAQPYSPAWLCTAFPPRVLQPPRDLRPPTQMCSPPPHTHTHAWPPGPCRCDT